MIFSVLLFVSAINGKIVHSLLSNTFISITGGMCYTIYLVHLPLAELISSLHITYIPGFYYLSNLAIHLVVLAIVTWIFSAISFYLFEKPFMGSRRLAIEKLKN